MNWGAALFVVLMVAGMGSWFVLATKIGDLIKDDDLGVLVSFILLFGVPIAILAGVFIP